jgi:hypothetical protein
MGLLIFFFIFTDNRPAALLADNNSLYRDFEENLTDNLSSNILVYNSDGDILIDDKSD